ncbi:MAG: hypothetical protein M9899_07705 [Bdellovibrionaceae bacterium]|nr:hypothetical protein [Pseudobdellovibrionaceae bacterium]
MNYEDNYDPFADYSEFVEATSEEADINFFKYGRMLSVAGILGMHMHTGNLAKYNTRDPMLGISASYFFSLRFALQGTFYTTTHQQTIPDGATRINSRVRMNTWSAHAKYFLNTQNMTRSLGDLNPFILGGFSQIRRQTNTSFSVLQGLDGSFTYDVGFGFEYMFNRRRNFAGLTVLYHYANFPNENENIPSGSGGGGLTGVYLSGDVFWIGGNIGINF